MNLAPKKTSLIILGITSLIFSRGMFFFFDDPEGPNLLVTTVTAAIVYLVTFVAYTYSPQAKSLKKLLVTIIIQLLLVTTLYFCLR